MSWTALGYRRNGVSETPNFNSDAINAQLALKVNAEGSGTVADNALVRWDGVGGKDIQSSSATLSDVGVLTTAIVSTDIINERTLNAGIIIDGALIKDDNVRAVSMNTDTINEKTLNNGITIDGVLIKDNTITTNGVIFNSETITALPANISTTIRYTFINLATVPSNLIGGLLTTEIYEGGNTRHPILPVAVDGMLKTIKLDEGYPYPITIETNTSAGASPYTRYFTLSPSNRTLHLRYNGAEGAWELDEGATVSWLFNTDDTVPVKVANTTYYPQTNYDGSRVVHLEFASAGDANPTNLIYRLYTNLDYTTVATTSLTPFFLTTGNTANRLLSPWAIALSQNGNVLAIGNKGNGTSDWGEIAIFRFNTGTGLYAHELTFTATTPTGFGFGWWIQLSADGSRLVSRNTTEVFMYNIGVGTATLSARFTIAGTVDSSNTIAISGDGNWVSAGDTTTRNLFVWSFLTGTWTQVYTTTAVAYGMVDLDYYGTTLMVGDSEFYSTLKGVVRIYSRKPKALGSTFTLLQTISISETYGANPTQGNTATCKLSSDGLTMVRSDRYKWGIDTRTSLQTPFTEFATQGQGWGNYGTAYISPDASTITLCRLFSAGVYRIQIRKRPASDMNRNLIDINEPTNLMMMKSDGYVGGSLQIASTTTSTSATTGSVITAGGLGVAENINVAGIIKSTNATSSTLITNGAIVAIGGAGIGENINAGGVIKSTATTQSSSISTGAIVSNGGIGCAKSMTVGEYVIASSAPTLGTHLCNKTYVDAKSAYTTGLTTASLNATHAGFITNPIILQFRGYKIGTIAFVNIEIFATTASHISSTGYFVNASAGHRFPAGFLPRTGTPMFPIMLDYDYYVSAGYTSKVQGCFVLDSDGDWTISMMEQQTAYTTVHADRDIGSAIGSIVKLHSCVLMYET